MAAVISPSSYHQNYITSALAVPCFTHTDVMEDPCRPIDDLDCKDQPREEQPEEGIIQSSSSSVLSSESEEVVIVITDSSGDETNEELIEGHFLKNRNKENLQSNSASEANFALSSNTEMTSEGGDSEAETPATNEALKSFLEYVLSDEGLARDMFLLSQVRRYKHGYVSLQLLTDYKEAKLLKCSVNSLASAAKQSLLLEVNPEGLKVRRKNPLPEILRKITTSRFITAVDIQNDMSSIESLASVFETYGTVRSVSVFRKKNGKLFPKELLALKDLVPKIAHTNCAIVEYDHICGAATAMKEFTHPTTSLHAISQSKKNSSSKPESKNRQDTSGSDFRRPRQSSAGASKKEFRGGQRQRIMDDAKRRDSTASETDEIDKPWRQSLCIGRNTRSPTPKYRQSFQKSSRPTSTSPHFTRWRTVSEAVTREPKGPDGTKGFHKTDKK